MHWPRNSMHLLAWKCMVFYYVSIYWWLLAAISIVMNNIRYARWIGFDKALVASDRLIINIFVHSYHIFIHLSVHPSEKHETHKFVVHMNSSLSHTLIVFMHFHTACSVDRHEASMTHSLWDSLERTALKVTNTGINIFQTWHEPYIVAVG